MVAVKKSYSFWASTVMPCLRISLQDESINFILNIFMHMGNFRLKWKTALCENHLILRSNMM